MVRARDASIEGLFLLNRHTPEAEIIFISMKLYKIMKGRLL